MEIKKSPQGGNAERAGVVIEHMRILIERGAEGALISEIRENREEFLAALEEADLERELWEWVGMCKNAVELVQYWRQRYEVEKEEKERALRLVKAVEAASLVIGVLVILRFLVKG